MRSAFPGVHHTFCSLVLFAFTFLPPPKAWIQIWLWYTHNTWFQKLLQDSDTQYTPLKPFPFLPFQSILTTGQVMNNYYNMVPVFYSHLLRHVIHSVERKPLVTHWSIYPEDVSNPVHHALCKLLIFKFYP